MRNESWPPLPLAEWQETYATLHRWLQLCGKIQLALTPRVNHFWNVAFAVTPRGLSTGILPWGDEAFDMEFDFLDHELVLRTSRKETRALPLVARTVADFESELMTTLAALGVEVAIDDRPVEIATEAIPFHEDVRHASYDPEPVERLHRLLLDVAPVLAEFRARFIGKASPVQFYWGSFDLTVSRYSGRRAPPRPGADRITREAYSHEVSAAGFWPGDARFPEPAFYSYFAPVPSGFPESRVRPASARWQSAVGEFLLPYEAVRRASDPRAELLEFLQSVYETGASLAGWDRPSLEARTVTEAGPAETPTLH